MTEMAAGRPSSAAGTIALACAAVGIAVVAAVPGEGGADTEASLLASGSERGTIRIANSKRGEAILSAAGMSAGSVTRGGVRIANAGEAPARLYLRMLRLRDTRGPGGERLSDLLELRMVRRRVRNVAPLQTPPGRLRRTLYEGPLAELGRVRLGRWRPGAHRRFRFRVELPESAAGPIGSGSYAGAGSKLRFVWRARSVP